MSNTFSGIIPILYQSLDEISRELVGFIPAVTRNSSAERAAVGQSVTWPIVGAASTSNITPGTTAPDDGDQTITDATLTISKSKYAPVRWTGEEIRSISDRYADVFKDQVTQAMRTLVNEVEADLAALYKSASRAYGTGGAAPFGTAGDFTDFAGVMQILDDNGTPSTDRHLVLGSSAIANLRGKQNVLFKVNEAGTSDLLRRGILGQVLGMDIHNSAQVKAHTKGTGTSYITNSTALATGVTSIPIDTGSGTVLAGDVIGFSADANNKFVVKTGVTAAGTIVIGAPGLRGTIADNNAMTINTSYAANMYFHRRALQLVTRAPAMPPGGDMADDVTEITDPVSGLAFQVAKYRQYRRVKYEIALAWGVACSKTEDLALLIG